MFTGTIEEFNGQSIKTKFFILGIPLFPISSYYFVGKNKGMETPLIGKSARFGFARTFCLAAGLGLAITCQINDHWPNREIKILAIAAACIFMFVAIYSWIKQQSIPESDKKYRLILEKAIGYNMLPSKLPKATRLQLRKVIASKMVEKYKEVDVNTIFTRTDYESSEIPLLYSMALYTESINPNPITKAFLAKFPAENISI